MRKARKGEDRQFECEGSFKILGRHYGNMGSNSVTILSLNEKDHSKGMHLLQSLGFGLDICIQNYERIISGVLFLISKGVVAFYSRNMKLIN